MYPNGERLGDTFDCFIYRWFNEEKPRPDGKNITCEEEVFEVVEKCRGDWKLKASSLEEGGAKHYEWDATMGCELVPSSHSMLNIPNEYTRYDLWTR